MDIKETLLETANSQTTMYSYVEVERLIVIMMRDYLKCQGKRLFLENEVTHGKFDMILPDGINNDESCIAAEIKLFRHKRASLEAIYKTMNHFSVEKDRFEFDKFLLIVEEIRRGLTLLQNSSDKVKICKSLRDCARRRNRKEEDFDRRGLTLLQNSFNKEKYVNSLARV